MSHDTPGQTQKPEVNGRLRLRGALESFQGTSMAGLIDSSLQASGIDPAAYDPKEYGHYQYMGFPTNQSQGVHDADFDEGVSPIITALNGELEAGRIIIEKVDHTSVDMLPWSVHTKDASNPYEGNAFRTSKLMSVGMLAFKDAETGTVMAYAPRLGSDGGRPGRVLISVNDVRLSEKSAESELNPAS